jgi:serine/threonine protein kinase
MIGKTISHYKIIEKLGEGGMCVIYRAQDTKLKRTVTLKFLTPQVLASEEERSRFVHDAQTISTWDHPNIAKIYEIGKYEGEYFISMDYLEGKSLKEIIKDKPISIRAAVEIAIKIGEGLSAAHKREIIHRNLRSDNVMLTKEGGIKIVNFGLPTLKVGSGLIETETTLDMVQYMPPEQAQGGWVDHRTDIFSFGVVLYEMITGKLPFKGKDEAAIIHSIVNEAPEPLARNKREVPKLLQRIVDRLLQKDTKLRFQTTDEVLADLERLKHELISKRRLVFRKIRPKYKTILIPALIICFIIAVILLLLLNKYLLTPIFEKKGSAPHTSAVEMMCFREGKLKWLFANPSRKFFANSDNLNEIKRPLSKSAHLGNKDTHNRERLGVKVLAFYHPERIDSLGVS